VAHRVDQVLLRPRPRRRVRRDRRGALPRRLAAPRALVPAPGAGRRGHRGHLGRRRPPRAELGLRVGGVRGRAGLSRAARWPRRGAAAGRARARRVHPREPHRRAQPPHARALRASDRRPRAARPRRRRRAARPRCRAAAREPPHRRPPRRRAPRAVDALPLHRAALVPRRARERPPVRPRAARRLRRAPCARVRVRDALPSPGRPDPRAERQRHGLLHRPAAAGRRPARPRRLPLRRDGGPRGDAAAAPLPELPRGRLPRAAQRLGRPRPRVRRRALPAATATTTCSTSRSPPAAGRS
jgi:hypothetical protein